MFRFRALLSGLFVFIACVLVGCGGPSSVAIPPTYTATQLQQIQQYLPEIQSAYDRLDKLGAAIQDQNWQEVRSTIRGPFGSMIQDLKYVTSHLLPEDQKTAREVSRSIFQDFIGIDQAATESNVDAALRSFDSTVKDIDAFLSQLPALPAAKSEQPLSIDEAPTVIDEAA